jgi:hypothetical protein
MPRVLWGTSSSSAAPPGPKYGKWVTAKQAPKSEVKSVSSLGFGLVEFLFSTLKLIIK